MRATSRLRLLLSYDCFLHCMIRFSCSSHHSWDEREWRFVKSNTDNESLILAVFESISSLSVSMMKSEAKSEEFDDSETVVSLFFFFCLFLCLVLRSRLYSRPILDFILDLFSTLFSIYSRLYSRSILDSILDLFSTLFSIYSRFYSRSRLSLIESSKHSS